MTTLPLFATGDTALFVGSALAVQAGEVHHSESLFPPPPSTFQGAVRSHLLRAWEVDLNDRSAVRAAIGLPERLPDGWSIDGPWVAGVTGGAGEVLMPWTRVPLCAVAGRREEDEPRGVAPRAPVGPLSWRLRDVCPRPPDLLLDPDASVELVRGGPASPESWLSADDLWTLLSTGAVRAARHVDPPFARSESRVGLALESASRTAKSGMLYFQRKVRLSGVPGTPRAGLAAWLELPPGARPMPADLRAGCLQLGRRASPLTLEPMPTLATSWTQLTRGAHLRALPAARLGEGMEVWLVLATPVALYDADKHGTPSRPRLPVDPRCRVEVTAAILAPPLRIGGIDLANHGSPKPVLPYLPAGCAWRLRLSGGTAEDRREALIKLHHRCTLGEDGARSFGFGRTWIALPPEETP
jgi:hypothetical protein